MVILYIKLKWSKLTISREIDRDSEKVSSCFFPLKNEAGSIDLHEVLHTSFKPSSLNLQFKHPDILSSFESNPMITKNLL